MAHSKYNFNIILEYYNKLVDDCNHRYKSWEHCYEAFGKTKDKKILSLHLSFYLASWGMYRGSGGLLQKDYKVNLGAVEILLKKRYYALRCSKKHEVSKVHADEIIQLISDLSNCYNSIEFNSKNGTKNLKATNTLISKVLLGTLGCLPAFDRYFINGVKVNKLGFANINKPALSKLFDFVNENKSHLRKIQAKISKNGIHYPLMKLLDMYFWEIGSKKSKKK